MDESRSKIRAGIIFALPEEAQGLERVLWTSHVPVRQESGWVSWFAGNVELMVAVGGVGRKRCAHAAANLIRGGAQWIVCAGFAAGLDPAMKVGDVFVAGKASLMDGQDCEPVRCHKDLVAAVPPSGKFGFVIRHGDLVTVDTVVCSAHEKSEVFRATGAAALDMESYAAGEVCKRDGVPFLILRAISDCADDSLPDALRTIIEMEGTLDRGLFAITHPSLWLPMVRLRRHAHVAADNLGEVLGLMVLRLV